MKKRKTIDVKFMVDYANKQLARPENETVTKAFKAGICVMIENILMETGNYKGFQFIENNNSELNTFGFYTRYYNYKN